jgi:hypothetical protein
MPSYAFGIAAAAVRDDHRFMYPMLAFSAISAAAGVGLIASSCCTFTMQGHDFETATNPSNPAIHTNIHDEANARGTQQNPHASMV